jgi:hypothetical protein
MIFQPEIFVLAFRTGSVYIRHDSPSSHYWTRAASNAPIERSTFVLLASLILDFKFMIRLHGDAYRHYKKAVSMIVPLPNNPQEIEQARSKARAAGV